MSSKEEMDISHAQQVCLLASRLSHHSGDLDSLAHAALAALRELCGATLACWFTHAQNSNDTPCLINGLDQSPTTIHLIQSTLTPRQPAGHPLLLAILHAHSTADRRTDRIPAPIPASFGINCLPSSDAPLVTPQTFLRRDLISDKDWYASPVWRKVYSPLGLDDCILSIYPLHNNRVDFMGFVLHRPCGDACFDLHHRHQLHLLHCAIGHRLQTAWANQQHHPLADLRPRLRQTLEALLRGDSEKQIAFKLNISPHTVHNYVKDLYRRYQVSSRGELLARFIPPTSVASTPASTPGTTPASATPSTPTTDQAPTDTTPPSPPLPIN